MPRSADGDIIQVRMMMFRFTIDVASSTLGKEEAETWIRDKAIRLNSY